MLLCCYSGFIGTRSLQVYDSSITAQRFNVDGALVGGGQDAVLVEDAAGCAAYT